MFADVPDIGNGGFKGSRRMNDESSWPSAAQIDEAQSALIRERLRRVEQGKFVAYEVRETLAHLDEALAVKRRGGNTFTFSGEP
jgi:hypothetical protein